MLNDCEQSTGKLAGENGRELLPQRIKRLKDAYLRVKPSLRINRALAFTEVAQEFPDLPKIVQRALGFKRACETAPLLIQDDELLVGHPCGAPRAGSFSPDIAWKWVQDELDALATRSQDPYEVAEEDKKILREKVFPFWEGRSLDEACEAAFREAGVWEFSAEAFVSDLSYHHTSGGGDTSPGYDIILLTKGMNGIKREAEQHLARLQAEKSEHQEQINFYQAAITTCEGVNIYSARLAAYARELATREQDPDRRKELEQIAEVNERVPAEPPASFQEGLQAVWTVQSLFLLEENQCSTSLGRVDQYLLPYYQNDIRCGLIDQERAFELLACFIIKCSEMIWYTPDATAKYFAGYMPFINMCVGGLKREGGDGTNDLTYLVMDTVKKVGMYQPSLACRIHNQSPQKYLQAIVEVIKAGGGMPACHFDDAHIKMMLRKGFDFEDARDYCLMGCVEPQRSGRIHQWTAGGFTQWPIAIEFVFNRGLLKSHGTLQGLDTGALEDMNSYQHFEAAVQKQIDHIAEMTAKGSIINQRLFSDMTPSPYMSLFVEGCMEKGKDVTAGGANLYDGPGTIFAGLGTYVDSMAAIKRLVYEEKKYTLSEVKEALDANWLGYDTMHKDCMNAPKYGNDDDFADDIATRLIDYTEKTMNSHKSLYARMIHGTLSQSFNTPLGEMIGATPNGRKAGEPLSDGMSPSQGADTMGPTSVVKSVSKLNVEAMSLGMAHNFKLLQGSLDTPEGENGLITLLRSASILGNGQMQFNYVDNETLIKAQQNPAQYRDLMVRVAGYSAFFVELCKEVQDEIISRTMLE